MSAGAAMQLPPVVRQVMGSKRSSVRQRALTLACIAVGAAATYSVAHGSLYTQGLVETAAVFGVLAISLDIVAGMLGLYSLGHAGLFALGAYATTLMQQDHGTSVFVMLPVCVVGVGLVGMILGAVSLRVSGLYFAIATFVFTLVLTVVASDSAFTGGEQGLLGPQFPSFSSALSGLGNSVAWVIGLCLAVTIVIAVCLRRSPLYPVLLAIRDAEPMASAAGARTPLIKIGMFGLSAALAGLAGWAFSFLGVVSPGQFTWSVSVNVLVMVILGGMNTTLGPLIGAAFVSMFPTWVNISPTWQQVLFGALLIVVIAFAPAGAVGLGRDAVLRLLRRDRTVLPGSQPAPDTTHQELDAATLAPSPPERVHRGEDAVRVRDLVFSYGGGVVVVNHVDLTVRAGTIHGLIGPNGSGKSTLLNLIAGRLRPSAGTIEINGEFVQRGGAPQRARLGFSRTFQDAHLVSELSAAENVGLGLYTDVRAIAVRAPLWSVLPGSRATSRTVYERSASALRRVGAGDWAGARIGDTPHGVHQLTQLATAAVSSPRTIVLDEPLAGLSSSEVDHVAALLRGLRDSGVSVLLIEHQPHFVFSVCDEVTVLNAGSVIATGPAAEVRSNDEVRRVYLGL
jgi:branched-chain amino acid transport system permease protein